MNIRSFPQNPTSIFFTCRQLLVGLESRKWCYSKVKSLKVLFQRSQTFFKCYLTMLVSRLINWVVFFGNLWHRKYQRSKCIMSSSETGKISDHPLIIIFIYLLQGNPVEKQLIFQPPILAYDQDLGINASLQYSITKGMKKIWRDIEKMIRHYKSYTRLSDAIWEKGIDCKWSKLCHSVWKSQKKYHLTVRCFKLGFGFLG